MSDITFVRDSVHEETRTYTPFRLEIEWPHATEAEALEGMFVDGVAPEIGDCLTLEVYEIVETDNGRRFNARFKTIKK